VCKNQRQAYAKQLDVTRFVRSGGRLSFVVSKSGGEARISSREGAAAFWPRLVLVLNGAPLCQGGDRATPSVCGRSS
jgi:hypothetical protein